MPPRETDTAYVICVGSPPEDVAAVARALKGGGVVIAAADADALGPLLADYQPPSVQVDSNVRLGSWSIDRGLREVTVGGRTVEMSALEFDLFELLAGDMGKVWTFAEITEAVWKTPYLGDADMLLSAVKRLRRRLASAGGEVQVVSVRGVGFRLVVRAAVSDAGGASGVLAEASGRSGRSEHSGHSEPREAAVSR